MKTRLEALEQSNLTNLRGRIAAQSGLSAEAASFISGTDEASITAQVNSLKALSAPASAAAPVVPPAAGTATAPPATQAPTIDEQIAAAQLKNNPLETIRLKRLKASGTV